MKLPERRILSRREALPDPIPQTDRATVAAAAATLANPYLLRQVPTGWLVTGLQVGEQGLMAATAQTLLRLNDKVFAGANPKPELLTLTACLVAPAVIRAARAPLEILWASTVRDSYDAAFVAQSFNRPSTWVMGKGEADFSGKKEGGNVRAERTELYAGNLRWHAQNQVQATVELQGVALAAAANLAIFSTNLGVVMGLAQATALALAMAYGRRAFAEISTNAQAQTAASNALGAHKRRFWDNKTLGNVNNAQRWQERCLCPTGRCSVGPNGP
jgi:hypothetical protein